MRLRKARQTLRRFAADDSGTTAIEYAIIAGGITLAIIAIVTTLGDAVFVNYQSAAGGFNQ